MSSKAIAAKDQELAHLQELQRASSSLVSLLEGTATRFQQLEADSRGARPRRSHAVRPSCGGASRGMRRRPRERAITHTPLIARRGVCLLQL